MHVCVHVGAEVDVGKLGERRVFDLLSYLQAMSPAPDLQLV